MGKRLGTSQLVTGKQEALCGCHWGMAEATIEVVLELDRMEELLSQPEASVSPKIALGGSHGP